MFKEKFLRYVKIDTMSSDTSTTSPSSLKQLDLAKLLKEELTNMGLSDVLLTTEGLVYAKLKGNTDKGHVIGLVAHMDTSPDASGKNVNPRIIENYDGQDIYLNEEVTIDVLTFPNLKRHLGSELIVTDGTTLLGADNKAGIAIINTFIENLKNSNQLYNDIHICFTPDEEVGRGTENFKLDHFPVDFCYTVDGSSPEVLAYENFNAATAFVKITGLSVHPGDAKDKLVNASSVATEFHSMLNKTMTPENTENREGFNHLTSISGTCEEANLVYIIRNHDMNLFNSQKEEFENIKNYLNNKYPYELVNLEIKDSYYNMYEIISKDMTSVELAKKAILEVTSTYETEAIRGGTDGARLTFMGVSCPNIGTGGYNFHGKREYLSVNEALQVIEILNTINRINVGEN